MEIIVKKDILDELRAKGVCHTKEEAETFLNSIVQEMTRWIGSEHRVQWEEIGSFYVPGSAEGQEISFEHFMESLVHFMESQERAPLREKERVLAAMRTFLRFLKGKLLEGYEVQIPHFTSFLVEEQKAQITTSSRTGKKVVSPQQRVLTLLLEKDFILQTKKEHLSLEPDGQLRKQMEYRQASSILCLMPERDFFVQTMEYYFIKAGWKVETVQSVEEGKKYLEMQRPHLVLLDSRISNHQELCESLKCNLESNSIPLVILYSNGTDLKKPSDFRICGDEHILEPFEIKHLFQVCEGVLRRASEEESLFQQEVLFQFPTMDKYIEKANELCTRLFTEAQLGEEEEVKLAAAAREAIANAAQHGNKHRRDKMLEVLYLLDQEKIILSVTDSGKGFDWQNFVQVGEPDAIGKARKSHEQGKLGGLGIMLMGRCVDKIEYNDAGNVITLTKYLSKKNP